MPTSSSSSSSLSRSFCWGAGSTPAVIARGVGFGAAAGAGDLNGFCGESGEGWEVNLCLFDNDTYYLSIRVKTTLHLGADSLVDSFVSKRYVLCQF